MLNASYSPANQQVAYLGDGHTELAELIIAEADADCDGRVSADEFAAAYNMTLERSRAASRPNTAPGGGRTRSEQSDTEDGAGGGMGGAGGGGGGVGGGKGPGGVVRMTSVTSVVSMGDELGRASLGAHGYDNADGDGYE